MSDWVGWCAILTLGVLSVAGEGTQTILASRLFDCRLGGLLGHADGSLCRSIWLGLHSIGCESVRERARD